MGKQLLWEVTIRDALAPSRLKQGSLCNHETIATGVEARQIEKYCKLRDNGYIFQPVEIQGENSEFFITRLCKMLCRSPDDQRAGSLLKQRMSMALRIGNADCALGTVSNRGAFEDFFPKGIF